MKKLEFYYAYPLRDKIVNNHFTFPFLDEEKVWKDYSKLLEEVSEHWNKLGFEMSMAVVEDDTGG
jgi:hypothetical protein